MIRYLTAGESHGPGLIAIGEGFPAGIPLDVGQVNSELNRRRLSVGRGGRGAIEPDLAEIISGVRYGRTLGAPIAFLIRNRDWENWTKIMSVEAVGEEAPPLTRPRPGHADLVGALKTGQRDLRNILERASARETAARVAVGSAAKALVREIGVEIVSHVTAIGQVKAHLADSPRPGDLSRIDEDPARCLDPEASEAMLREVRRAGEDGDTLGGVFEVIAYGVPPGLGGYGQWDERLDGILARAVMSVPAIKGVEIGEGFAVSRLRGSEAADEIVYDGAFRRTSNRMGGVEGGISTGEPLVMRAAMKPLPTVRKPLRSVDLITKQEATPIFERSDVCAVPRAAVVAEAMVALALADAALEKFGGDSLAEFSRNFRSYIENLP